MKTFLKIIVILFLLWWVSVSYAQPTPPAIYCEGSLPWCNNDSTNAKATKIKENPAIKLASKVIAEWIKYTTAISVIAIMLAWLMYMFSFWEEEKTKKAKQWIIWSLVWVLFSVSAYSIVLILDSLSTAS